MSISDDLNKAGEEARELSSAFKDIQQSVSDTNVGIQDASASFKTLGNLADQLKQHNQGITKLTAGQVKGLQDQAKVAKDNLKTSKELLQSKIEGLNILAKQKPGNKAINDELDRSLYVQDQITEQLEDQNSETSKLNKGLKSVKGSSEGTKKAWSSLSKIKIPFSEYLSPLMLINKVIGWVFGTAVELDASIGDAAKSLSMTYDEAADMRKEMADAAEASGDLLTNSKNTQKALLGINNILGSAVGWDQMNESLQEDVVLMGKLQGFAGLTAEETNKIQKYTLATGQNATEATKSLMAGYKVEGLRNKLVLNEKTALKEISKLSSAIKLSTKGGAQGLGEALANAKALGVDLGKVDDIAGSLLNFESSITAELEAELLLGKNINLEKARQAALDNDLATVASEIAMQTGGVAEFQKMNRIQQEAMAKAVGMTREGLAGMLEEQSALKEMSMESAELAEKKFNRLVEEKGIAEAMEEMGDNALTRQFEGNSLAELANANQEKMADLLASDLIPNMKWMAKNAAKFFKTVKDTLKAFGGMKTVLSVIGAIISIKLIQGMASFLIKTGEAIMATGLLGRKAKQNAMAEAAGTAMSSTKSLGLAAIPAAISLLAVAAAAIGGYMLMDDGAIPPGYGDRVLSTPKGKIAFNNDDTIVAGTNLGGKGGGDSGGGMEQTNSLLQELITTIKTTGKVELDGQRVGDALNLGSYNIQ